MTTNNQGLIMTITIRHGEYQFTQDFDFAKNGEVCEAFRIAAINGDADSFNARWAVNSYTAWTSAEDFLTTNHDFISRPVFEEMQRDFRRKANEHRDAQSKAITKGRLVYASALNETIGSYESGAEMIASVFRKAANNV